MRVLYSGAGIVLDPCLVGMHFHRWPQGSPLSSAPSYGFGTVRSHDYDPNNPGVRWFQFNIADGAYDWTSFDAWVGAHALAGRRLIHTIYGTPGYLKTSNTLDPYGRPGGASPPADSGSGFPAVQAMVTALINRYNDGTSQGRKIWGVEVWNEPNFAGVESGFWWGTAAQMVDMARAVTIGRNASVDPGVKVLSPGFVDGNFNRGGILDTFLSTESAMAPGTYGADWYDETAVHIYGRGYDWTWKDRTEVAVSGLKKTLATYPAAAGRPWHVTEQGTGGALDGVVSPWLAFRPDQKGLWQARHVVLQGIMGAKSVCLFSHDNLAGADFREPTWAAPINRVHEELAGKTVTHAVVRADRTFELIADGQVVRL